MYYVTAHYDVIYYIYHRRKRHFVEIVDIYNNINEVIICIGIINFRLFFLKHKFHLFSYNIRYKLRLSVENRQSYCILKWCHILYDTITKCYYFAYFT